MIDEQEEVWFTFPCGGQPFRPGDRFAVRSDIGVGTLVRFVRVDDDLVELHAVDASARHEGDAYLCERDSTPDKLAFVLLPRLSS